uniref:Uncharacterized protein n=1 Tax=Anopheles atroparvus TaxID=41427 RepID=A0A182JEB6_ANOAO
MAITPAHWTTGSSPYASANITCIRLLWSMRVNEADFGQVLQLRIVDVQLLEPAWVQGSRGQIAFKRLRCHQEGELSRAQKTQQKQGVGAAVANSRSCAKFCRLTSASSRIDSSVFLMFFGPTGSSQPSSSYASAYLCCWLPSLLSLRLLLQLDHQLGTIGGQISVL